MPNTQVAWWEVHLVVQRLLDAVGEWPMAGTPEWCALPNDDPKKLAGIYDAAQHWALRVDTCQEATCQASQAISAAADWRAIARELKDIREFRAANPWARRKVS